jgi:Predicted nucleotide-binding protein containing TIR-like domain
MDNNTFKPFLFIGSSKEGLPVAEFVKKNLSDVAECYIWNDDVFKFNKGFLDTLVKASGFFDFGILIATKDDVTTSRANTFETARDNVIFEFGLFLGRLGPNRTFLLQEEGVKLPSDLLGVTMPRFDKASLNGLYDEVQRIKATIVEKTTLGELGFLPSTALAIGYFNSFVLNLCESLCTQKIISIGAKEYSSYKLRIVIPKDLDSDIGRRAKRFFERNGFVENSLPTKNRSYPIHFNETATEKGLYIYDMPTTLNGIDKAIELYMSKGHVGKDAQQTILEKRELNNFRLVLSLLIANNSETKDNVEIIEEY